MVTAVGLSSFAGLPAVGAAVLACRWVFSTSSKDRRREAAARDSGDFGLLVPVADPADAAAAERVRERLAGHGIRATVATVRPPAEPVRVTADGRVLPPQPVVPLIRVLVFPADEAAARGLLAGWL